MKQSEFKKQLEEKLRVQREESKEFWANLNAKAKTYKNMVCENLQYNIGGYVENGVFGMCWICDKCGRSGVNYKKDSLREIDSLIEEKCDLEVG